MASRSYCPSCSSEVAHRGQFCNGCTTWTDRAYNGGVPSDWEARSSARARRRERVRLSPLEEYRASMKRYEEHRRLERERREACRAAAPGLWARFAGWIMPR